MAVSVKIREDTKRRLERLSVKLGALTGKDLSFQEIVDAVAKAGEADLSSVMDALAEGTFPLPEATQRQILASSWDFGFETSEEDIDRVLYSDEAIHGGRRASSKGRK